jgi:hypothetical protein
VGFLDVIIMKFKTEIILDSVAPSGSRLTTFVLTYPRFIHSEFMTHRKMSKNSASSRALPIQKNIDSISNFPAMPIEWGTAKPGMQAGEETKHKDLAQKIWLEASKEMVLAAQKLAGIVSVNENGEIVPDNSPDAIKLNIHKQVTNRILEPFMWMTVICTATDYDNFFALRCHPDAQPEIQKLANMMKEAYDNSTPLELNDGEWHTPFIQEDEKTLDVDIKKKIAVARSARVSYLTHDGKRNIEKDLELYDRLIGGSGTGHWSPFEHVAIACAEKISSGNFDGFIQFRKLFDNENQVRKS